ncbi:hypothetical protein BGZ89_006076 [Linnemannia elongata]|nr:hypothetical protein BGZ89_006076 [Linnemannia elongata]
MDALVAYMSNVDMMHRRLNPGKTAGNKAADIDQEMANYVNKVCNFSPSHQNYWTAKKANKSYGYARTLYDEANTLRTSTGSGNTLRSTLRAEMLALCPMFDDLHRIFSAQLTRNHPPSRDAAPEARAHYNLEMADLVESESDTDSNAGEGSSTKRSAKKRKRAPTGMECMDERISQFRTAIINSENNFASMIADERKDHRAAMKEELREHREAMDKEKQQIEARREKEEAEFREKMRQRGLEQHNDFKYRQDRLDADRADLKAQQLELKQDRDEFKKELREFQKERERLLIRASVLERELELRQRWRSPVTPIMA